MLHNTVARGPAFVLRYATSGSVLRFYSDSRPKPASTPSENTISSAVVQDHDELREYYQRIKAAADDDERTRWANQFRWELARHSIGEELVVYPEYERLLGAEGKELADRDRADHQEVKEQLKVLQDMYVDDPKFQSTLDTLMDSLEEHMNQEESVDLPALEKKLDGTGSEKLLKSFQRTKHFVPTRSHPSAPDKPPFETVAGLMAAPMDKLRDLFSKFPQ
ncbi:hypothetical protein BOTBODRAFT_164979 [Botryobasidium botryosum FD-172 SS1]|uniref:Hemerythrin-like domain-containing protein n=1 Tax=Botryobasidium botryosum (strain FD-172 SS1) TaxID=930990 RepID=A0A067M3P7_BOTB1|nr:hypothetical protein BOTBODRAFT_164979 [Botryobasidium botryosum FD-172 SS1]